MNDFEFPHEPKVEISMTDDEKKSHKKIFSKIGFAFLAYILISQGVMVLAVYAIAAYDARLLESGNFVLILNSVVQYIVAFPVLYLLLKSIPKRTPIRSSVGGKVFLKYAVVSMFIVYIGNYISTIIMTNIEALLGIKPENAVDSVLDNTSVLLSALVVGIIGPIVEELIFRKLFVDRLSPYGEAIAIVFPSLIFGLFHGNLYQFFYAFFLGVIFSYIYIRTGKIIYSMTLHMFINLFCGVFPSAVMKMFNYEEFLELLIAGTLTEEYANANMLPIVLLGAYEIIMLAMVGAGIAVFTRNLKNVRLNKGEVRFPKGATAEVVFFNAGTIALIAVCLLLIAYNTFV